MARRRRSRPPVTSLDAYKVFMSLVLRRAVVELLEDVTSSKPLVRTKRCISPASLLALAAAIPVPESSDEESHLENSQFKMPFFGVIGSGSASLRLGSTKPTSSQLRSGSEWSASQSAEIGASLETSSAASHSS